MKQITQMGLLNLFMRCNACDLDMSIGERLLMSALLTYCNTNKQYEAFPSGDTLVLRTGLSIKSIEKFRKRLSTAGWFKLVSGKGWGNSNRYYINVVKIIEAYNKSAADPYKFAVDELGLLSVGYNGIPHNKEPHKRNTSGLMQGNMQPAQYVKLDTWDEEIEEPF